MANSKNFNQRLNGLNPLSYVGVNAYQPPDFFIETTSPTISDSRNVSLGTWWLNTTNQSVWILTSLAGGVATWVQLAGQLFIGKLTGNSGGGVGPTAQNIYVVGDGTTITIVGNPGTSTLTASLIEDVATSFITNPATGTATPASGVLTFASSGGISVSASGSTVTIGVTIPPSFLTWSDVTTSTAMAPSYGYTSNSSSLITFTLPAVAAYGTELYVVGKGTGLWKIAQNAGQTINYGAVSTTTGVTGYLSSTLQYDVVGMVCSVANTTWTVIQSIGDITYN